MNNLYNEIYKAVNEGIQKALLIDPEQNDISINYSYHKIDNYIDPLQFEFVDLGLPSGTLWCDHNLGATCENDASSWYGNYYAWGEIKPKDEYNQDSYSIKLYKQVEDLKFFKYNAINNKLNLSLSDDAVHAEYKKVKNSQMARKIKMPTKEQCAELKNCTTSKWVTDYNGINGLNGKIFIGINGNHIFIPASGHIDDTERKGVGLSCYLWSNTINPVIPNNALHICFNLNKNIAICSSSYFNGYSIRGVYQK